MKEGSLLISFGFDLILSVFKFLERFSYFLFEIEVRYWFGDVKQLNRERDLRCLSLKSCGLIIGILV